MDTLHLPATLDLKTAAQLLANFQSKRGVPIDVDAGNVERVGGLGLQILLAAHAAWEADGLSLRFDPVSDEFRAGLTSFGAAAMLGGNAEG